MNDVGNMPATDEQMIEIQNKLLKEIRKDLRILNRKTW